jgi:RNA polymerase sigma-70 factor (ECF subfamily)
VVTPERRLVLSVEGARAQRALSRLSAKKREVFVLVALEGMSGAEVANALHIPVATVWTRLHHARLELRAALARGA